GYAHSDLGHYQRALEFLRENVAVLAGDRLRQQFGLTGFPSANSRSHAAWCLAELGDFAVAEGLGTEGLSLAEAMDQPFSINQALWCLGRCYARQGAFDRAIPVLEQGMELCRLWGIAGLHAYTVAELGYAYALSGQVTEGLPLLQEAVEQAETVRFMV